MSIKYSICLNDEPSDTFLFLLVTLFHLGCYIVLIILGIIPFWTWWIYVAILVAFYFISRINIRNCKFTITKQQRYK